MMRLKDKVAIVTGGETDIGGATALLFAREGARIVVGNDSAQKGGEIVSNIERERGNAILVKVNTTNATEVKEMIKKTVEVYGRIDVLCNIAGAESSFSVVDVPEEEWHRVLAANLESVYLTSKYALPAMIEQRSGVIINTSSIFGLVGWPNAAVSCASQGGVIALTKQMAVDYGPHNIRINCICHAPIFTPSISRLLKTGKDAETAGDAIAQMHPLGRFVRPEEIGRAALFLASEESSFITGVVLPVDGGYTAK